MLFLRLLAHLAHLSQVSGGWYVCLLAVLLLTSCSSPSTVNFHATSTATTKSSSSQATPPATTGPALVLTPLAAPPSQCALRPPPGVKQLDHLGANIDVHLVGGGPFWIPAGYLPSVLHLAQFGELSSLPWPMTKIVAEVGPNYDQPVTLRLREMQTGALAWWTDAQRPPRAATRMLILDPQTDTHNEGGIAGQPYSQHGSPDPGWKEWGIFPLFSVAGCYQLQVSWSGGSWQSSFAVGN